MKILISHSTQSPRPVRRLGQSLLLFLLAATAPAPVQGANPTNGLPYIDVTAFTTNATGAQTYTVTSSMDGIAYTVLVKNNNANIPNPASGTYGATPGNGQTDDDASAFLTALTILNAAGGGYLYVPTGTYCFKTQVAIDYPDWDLTIQGQPGGDGVQIYCDNNSGAFKFSNSSRYSRVTIRDIALVAFRPNAGNALQITLQYENPNQWDQYGNPVPMSGLGDSRSLVAENIIMRYPPGTTCYFNNGLVMGIAGIQSSACYRSIVENCRFSAPAGTGSFPAYCGFDVSECYDPVLSNCTVSGAENAYKMQLSNRQEGSAFQSCSADQCAIGMAITDTSVGDPDDANGAVMFCVRNCTIKARDIGLKIEGHRFLQIEGNTFGRLASTAFTDIYMRHTRLGSIVGNTFADSAASRTNILVTTGVDRDKSYDLILGPNTLSDAQPASTSSLIITPPSAEADDIFRY